VLDGGAFGKGTAGFIRLCFATDERSLREGCARIRRFAASLLLKEGA
jgi:polar amino acid transport system ATP-binding protein/arginine:pyruvate transaminase